MALACLATNFAYSEGSEDRRLKLRAWQEAYRNLQELLNSPDQKIVLGNTESVPRSLWAAMKLCIDSLDSSDARKLLSLIYACKGEVVPEMVLTVWHASMKTSRAPFFKSMDELLMRELVKNNLRPMALYMEYLEDNGQEPEIQEWTTLWSLRSVVKLYMQQDPSTTTEIRSIIDELSCNEESSSDLTVAVKWPSDTEEIKGEKRRVAIALCALFFDRQHIDSTDAITRVGIASNTTHFYDDLHDLRRTAIEPIVWMLDKPVEEGQWTHLDVQRARKVRFLLELESLVVEIVIFESIAEI